MEEEIFVSGKKKLGVRKYPDSYRPTLLTTMTRTTENLNWFLNEQDNSSV